MSLDVAMDGAAMMMIRVVRGVGVQVDKRRGYRADRQAQTDEQDQAEARHRLPIVQQTPGSVNPVNTEIQLA
jgi:hypothetical protein